MLGQLTHKNLRQFSKSGGFSGIAWQCQPLMITIRPIMISTCNEYAILPHFIFLLCFNTLECSCPLLSHENNVAINLTGTRCGDIAVFECLIGYRMVHGGTQRTAVCLKSQWSVTSVACSGK